MKVLLHLKLFFGDTKRSTYKFGSLKHIKYLKDIDLIRYKKSLPKVRQAF